MSSRLVWPVFSISDTTQFYTSNKGAASRSLETLFHKITFSLDSSMTTRARYGLKRK